MEALSDTTWDVIISGTGLQQSLLALALSRSGKKVLHVDKNDYYGGCDAAFSLQEAEEWVKALSLDDTQSTISKAHIWRAEESSSNDDVGSKLSFSRAYTLTLSPQIIYSRSKILSQLVSSRVYKQLEFQAVGNWWLYQPNDVVNGPSSNDSPFRRLPNGREDIFSDTSIDVRAKRGLVKFLKFVVDYEAQPEIWRAHAETPLPDFLSSQFKLVPSLQTLVMALTLTLNTPEQTTVGFSLPRIARHLTSIGLLGPGFGAVLPKWGGCSEIAQVACRAGAVGGAVYILGTGVRSATFSEEESVSVVLTNDEKLSSKLVVQAQQGIDVSGDHVAVSKAICVVDSDLRHLFTSSVEGAPLASVTVVVFPADSLGLNELTRKEPVYIMVHSNDTGECPVGQCVLYATTLSSNGGQERLNMAINHVLDSHDTATPAKVLYKLSYEQKFPKTEVSDSTGVYTLPAPSPDLAFDDETLAYVEAAWRKVLSEEGNEDSILSPYMTFQDREGMSVDDEEEV